MEINIVIIIRKRVVITSTHNLKYNAVVIKTKTCETIIPTK